MHVFLESSTLPANPGNPGQLHDRLVYLANEGDLTIHVSAVAIREWKSHLLSGEELADVEKALQKFLRQPIASRLKSHGAMVEIWKQTTDSMPNEIAAEVDKMAKEFITKSVYIVEPVSESDTTDMWDTYFAGAGAFQFAKNRKDIPDSYIYSAAKRIVTSLDGETLHCIVNDKNLRSALAKIPHICTYEHLKQFIESSVAEPLFTKAEVSQPWDESQVDIIAFLQANAGTFADQIRSHVEENLPGSEVNGDIPSDNGDANVSSVQEISDITIDWENRNEVGPGWLFVPFSVDCELELDFGVYRSDVFHVPDWVHVDMGDFEEDYYFDASGCRLTTVHGELLLQWSPDQIKAKNWQNPETEIELGEAGLHDAESDSREPDFDGAWYDEYDVEVEEDEVE